MMITVNAMGDICPIPVVKTKKALGELNGSGQIEVLVDNETAMRNVMKMAKSSGAQAEAKQLAERQYQVMITVEVSGESSEAGKVQAAKDSLAAQQTSDIAGVQACPTCVGTVVAAGSDRMGDGSDELGHILMKSFIFAVTQLDTLPDKMLFYNSGAKLTIEGSECLEDLKNLEEQGVEILTCGTCLDYYGIKDKLAIGTVTNMYSIVEILQGAMSVIRP